MGLNTTGKPQPKDYLLGRGEILASAIDPTTQLPIGGFRTLGNAPAFTATVSSDTLTHTSSLEGLATIDAEVTMAQNCNLAFQLEEFNHQNLARFFAGDTVAPTNAAVAGFAAYNMIPAGQVTPGNWYRIQNAAGLRARDVEVGNLTITINAVACVAGTDYELDGETGRIFLIPTSTKVTGAVTNNYAVNVTLAADVGAKNIDAVRALTKSSVVVALMFISKNPRKSDKRTEYLFHTVTLSADGDLALIGTDWSKMPFKGSAQKNLLADPNSPTCTISELAD